MESLYANVDKAYKEGNTAMSRLKKPFRLEMQKSEVLASYRAHYISVCFFVCLFVCLWISLILYFITLLFTVNKCKAI